MKEFDFVFKGERTEFQLANGHISKTTICFEERGVYAVITASGKVEVFDMNDKLIKTESLPEQTGGKEVYMQVVCDVVDDKISLEFPVYEWIDNYPNCDGEHDRWDTKTIAIEKIEF